MGLFDRWFSPSTPDKFAQLIIRELKASGVSEPLQYNPADFSIKIGSGDSVRIHFLSNLHAEYLAANTAERKAILAHFVQSQFAPPEIPDDFAQVRAHLLPKTRSWCYHDLNRLRIRLKDLPADAYACTTKPLTDYFVIELAYDLPHTSGMVQDVHLKKWGVSFEEAFGIASDNLRSMDVAFLQQEQVPGVYVGEWQDSYAPSRLILPDAIRQLKVKGDPVAMIPHRNSLVVTGSEDDAGLLYVAMGASKFLNDPGWLSGVCLRLTDAGWRPFLPSEGHLAWLELQQLRVGTTAVEYKNQYELLNALVEQDKEDAFVADVMLMPDEITGAYSTVASWTKGVPTLLPKTDKLGLILPEEGEDGVLIRDWESVVQVAGDLLSPMGMQPERYRVESFPSEQQLEELRALS